MTIQMINIGASPNDDTGDDPRTAGQKLNSNFTTSTHAASRDVGTATGNIPDADDLNMVGNTNYTSGNLNPNVFGGNSGSRIAGTAVATSVILFKIKDSNVTEPNSITVTGNFDILNPDLTLHQGAVSAINISPSSGVGNVTVSATTAPTLTVGDTYWLSCNASGSNIEID